MARNTSADDSNRTRERIPTAAELSDGTVVIYDRENPEAWIATQDPIAVGEVQGE